MEQDNNPLKAGAFILNNIDMFNEAYLVLQNQVTPKLFEEMETIITEWLEENQWNGEVGWQEADYIWMTPLDWNIASDEQSMQIASIWFGYENWGDDSLEIADFCGCGGTRTGFFFGWPEDGTKKATWKNLDFQQCAAALEQLGFEQTGITVAPWFLPVTLDKSALTSGYEADDLEAAMQPFRDALAAILVAKEHLDPVVSTLKEKTA